MAELRPHYIDVDLKKNTQYNVPVVTQNDTATHFIIRVTDDGLSDPELLDAYQEITMTSQRPDGESFYLTGTRIPGTNEIEFHLGTDETAFSGSVLASLQFYLVEDASRYTSAQFRYDVKKDLTTNYTPTQREETLVEVVLRDGPGVIQEAKDAKIAVDGALVELEQDKTAAIERLDEVTEENKTIFQEPVATFAALSTTYPNPEHGTTVRVTSEAASYRYSDGTWVKTDEYNPTAIDQVTAQLAEKANDSVVRKKGIPIGLNDAGEDLLQALSEAPGVPFNLESIPRDLSVTPEKTTFVKASPNLFNATTTLKDTYVNNLGELEPSLTRDTSDYIKVKPTGYYVFSHDAHYHPFNAEFSSTGNTIAGIKGTSYRMNSITEYLRVSTLKDDTENFQVEEGSVSTPFMPHNALAIPGLYDSNASETIKMAERIDEISEISQVIKKSSNLFNKRTVLLNTTINDDGTLRDLPTRDTSDFIKVVPGEEYVSSHNVAWNRYTEDKQPVGLTQSTSAGIPFRPSSLTRYIRVVMEKGVLDVLQVNKGHTVQPYEEFGAVHIPQLRELDVVNFSQTFIDDILSQVSMPGSNTKKSPSSMIQLEDTGFTINWLARSYDNHLWGSANGRLFKSVDGGETHMSGARVADTIDLNAGEQIVSGCVFNESRIILITSLGRVIKYTGIDDASPEIVFELGGVTSSLATNFYSDGVNEYVFLGGYGHTSDKKDVYASTNGGDSFFVVIEGTTDNTGNGNGNNHIHSVSYDPHGGAVWMCQGDGLNRRHFVTYDWGGTVQEFGDGNHQPTLIVPFPKRIVFGRDNLTPGISEIARNDSSLELVNILSFREEYNADRFYPSYQPIKHTANEAYVLFTNHGTPDGMYYIYATGDGGESWHSVYAGQTPIRYLYKAGDSLYMVAKGSVHKSPAIEWN